MTTNEIEPFIITHPFELGRLFTTGHVKTPSGKKWNISFCPGLTGSWKGFKKCMECSWDAFKWGWNPVEHADLVKSVWDFSGDVGQLNVDLFNSIPTGMQEGWENITKLATDAPFGWIPRIVGNLIWKCAAVPIIKIVIGGVGLLIVTPAVFALGSIIGCVGKWFIGSLGAILSTIGSLVPLIGGPIVSGGITLGAILNRFPKTADNGTYGLYIIENPQN